MDLESGLNVISLSQKSYCSLVQPVKIDSEKKKKKEDELTAEEIKDYQSLLGKLNWLACNSRPDLKFEVFLHSQFKKPKVKDQISLNKVAHNLQKGPEKVMFPKLQLKDLRLICYTDASMGNLDEGVKSCKAYLIFLGDGERCAALSWNSKKIDRVCDNTLEAEARALKFGMTYAMAIAYALQELLEYDVPIYCYIDSKTLLDACYSSKTVTNPILRRDIALLQQRLEQGKVLSVERVESKKMLADILTKRGVNNLAITEVLQSGRLNAITN